MELTKSQEEYFAQLERILDLKERILETQLGITP